MREEDTWNGRDSTAVREEDTCNGRDSTAVREEDTWNGRDSTAVREEDTHLERQGPVPLFTLLFKDCCLQLCHSVITETWSTFYHLCSD